MSKHITDIYTDKIYHWLMFLKHNNLGFMRKDSLNTPPGKVKRATDGDDADSLIDTYHDINDQIIEEFGMEESFLAHKKTQEEIALLKLNFLISGNKMKRTQWKLKELEMQTPEDRETAASDLARELAIVSKHVGGGIIDIKSNTIHQYLTAKESLKQQK